MAVSRRHATLGLMLVALLLGASGAAGLAPLYGAPWEGGRRRRMEEYGEAGLPEGGAVVVVFSTGAPRDSVRGVVDALAVGTADAAQPAFSAEVSSLFAGMTGLAVNLTATALQYVRESDTVEFVEYDQPVTLLATQSYVCAARIRSRALFPPRA